jgi:hypothetical protein
MDFKIHHQAQEAVQKATEIAGAAAATIEQIC